MTSDAVLFELRDDGIALVIINRPEQRNCLSRDIREGLRSAWVRCEAEDSARIAILTGAGDKAFCAGRRSQGDGRNRTQGPAA